ncbi:hypothetical protein F5148DRAFT_1285498 [Russula earlei]|uniref:Uncharacterized protein n=1 Tax=Russula earlei TaxID=71964 RepID=A0ACC0U7J2_9AGAM|nr:hypothetical protein F5148DRAFT_1285498 [Russula earlei]
MAENRQTTGKRGAGDTSGERKDPTEQHSSLVCPFTTAPFWHRVNIDQFEEDLGSARETLSNGSAGIEKMRKELQSLADNFTKIQVRIHALRETITSIGSDVMRITTITDAKHENSPEHSEVCSLQEERRTLTRFDTELGELDESSRPRSQRHQV